METVALVISIAALVLGIIAIVVAAKRKDVVKEVVNKTEVVHAPVENPFVYDEEVKAYKLDGDLYATGFICALDNDKEV